MVEAEGSHLLAHRRHRPGVSCIRAVDVVGSDQDHIGSAPGVRGLLVGGAILLESHLFLNTDYLIFALLREQQLVHFQERLLECFFILSLLEILVGF